MRTATPVIAVVNRKGGSGKTTLAAHIAAYCANAGMAVMLGDVDRQRSTKDWLRRRDAQQRPKPAAIVGWAVEPGSGLRPPQGVSCIVLDTPGGLRGFDLARIVMFADAILMPVCNSPFDRESAADCHAELLSMPRVSAGRCKLAAVGMRLDARTQADVVLAGWARALQLPFIGVLRETQAYVRCVERGLTLFDLPRARVEADMAQWQPIIEWLLPVLHPEAQAATSADPARARTSSAASRPSAECAEAAPAGQPRSAGLPTIADELRPSLAMPAQRSGITGRIGGLFGALSLPRFLRP